MHIDKRKNYYLVVDVETAASMSNPLCYDIGFAITDKKGYVYQKWSFMTQEIFFDEKNIYKNPGLMESAYYAKKIPLYHKKLYDEKTIKCKSLLYIKKVAENAILKYNVKAICAYNAQFDIRALNATISYVTKSKVREFFPTDIPIYDIWGMFCETIGQQKTFHRFCKTNNFISDADNCRTSAEIAYAYLTNDIDFVESHIGLEDVLIELQIMAKCFRQHKKMTKTIIPMPWKLVQENFHETVGYTTEVEKLL